MGIFGSDRFGVCWDWGILVGVSVEVGVEAGIPLDFILGAETEPEIRAFES